MNNGGLIVGLTQTDEAQDRPDWSCGAFLPSNEYICVGFVWEQGQMTALPTLGGQNGFASSANNRRQVVGWAETTMLDPSCTEKPKPQFLAVLWDLNTGQTIELPPYPGGDQPNSTSAATDISDEGHVVGISGDCDQAVGRKSARHAVMWKDGMVNDLGNLGSDTWNTPTAVAPRGDIVVGFANTPEGVLHAWLWTERDDIPCSKRPNTNICDLGTLEPGGSAQAWGVNKRGQVVGTACKPDGYCRAFLWENGEMKDLEKLVGNFKYQLLNAMDINNRGHITGRAVVAPNVFETFIASPRN
jgi:probable HAF family extracellular repeat protein